MAEIVASAVASEAVSRISSLVSGDRTASAHQSSEDKAERLEMAVLKIQSIVAVSEDLKITHLPLLHWKAKLKRVAVEGNSRLHVHKKKPSEHSTAAMDDESCKPPLNNNGGIPLKLACHVSPYLLPEKHSSPFLQVEQSVILETMLPKVDEGFYNGQRQAMAECKREIWCPQSAMYCSVAPEVTRPLTMPKAYLMENSTDPINRRKRRKSHVK